ncbi:MAG: HAD-IA family hydrolase [Rhizobiales bacterium]|nr:HAD-IA family hydrolase [Hyphomicrobiales bacterium]
MPPRLVIFDMDDVLCHYDLGRRLRALAQISGKTPRDIRAAIWDSGFEDDADSGGYPDANVYLAEFSYRIVHPVTRQHWIAARRESMIPSSDVLALAEAIGKISRLAIYTNNGPIVKSSLDELFPEAAAIFKERYCSYEFGTKKPDPNSFTKLLTTIKISPADTWFIDDKRSNVQGAKLAGLKAHHFCSYEALAKDVKSMGFEIAGIA